ncbi:MAG TPA: hypothetical protein DD381_05985 [Lentisphaeria bacterium]|nr:MAG: hypothetical protein A2X47_14120 [Lentisphaerae bacterium GWF2_38_69]HBM15875.1 hypothetical protein [Lentisphaeria bacterium]
MTETKSKRSGYLLILIDFLIPIFLLLILSYVFISTDLDLVISSLFFDNGFNKEAAPWIYFYNYGMIPLWVSLIISLFYFIKSFICTNYRRYRKTSLFVILFIALGPGLIVNVILKENTGRPRPVQCSVFKGNYEFKNVLTAWQINTDNKSFPSGHASGAFSMIFPYFLFRRKNNKLAYLLLAGGTLYGTIVGIARIAQGGHFASDVIWSFGIVYLVGLALYYSMKLYDNKRPCQ